MSVVLNRVLSFTSKKVCKHKQNVLLSRLSAVLKVKPNRKWQEKKNWQWNKQEAIKKELERDEQNSHSGHRAAVVWSHFGLLFERLLIIDICSDQRQRLHLGTRSLSISTNTLLHTRPSITALVQLSSVSIIRLATPQGQWDGFLTAQSTEPQPLNWYQAF